MDDHHPILTAFLEAGGPWPIPGPLAQSMKATILKLDPKEGSALLAFDTGEAFMQGAGAIQGGIVAAMLDFAMAIAAFGKLAQGRSFATVSLNTHFLKPALPGPFEARAKLDRMGARLIFASSMLHLPGSKSLIATASAVMAITSR